MARLAVDPRNQSGGGGGDLCLAALPRHIGKG